MNLTIGQLVPAFTIGQSGFRSESGDRAQAFESGPALRMQNLNRIGIPKPLQNIQENRYSKEAHQSLSSNHQQ